MRAPPLPARIFVSIDAPDSAEAAALAAAIVSILRACGCQALWASGGPPTETGTARSLDDAAIERLLSCDGWLHLVGTSASASESQLLRQALPLFAEAPAPPLIAVYRLASLSSESAADEAAAPAPKPPGLEEATFASEWALHAAVRDFAARLSRAKDTPAKEKRGALRHLPAGVGIVCLLVVLSVLVAVFFPEWLADPRDASPRLPSHAEDTVAAAPEEAALRRAAKSSFDERTRLEALSRLAVLLHSQGRFAEAEPLYRDALARSVAMVGADHPAVLSLENNLAALLRALGRYDEAEPILRGILALRESQLGRTHPDTLGTIHNLAHVLQSAGRHDEAEPLYREAAELGAAVLGDEHPDTLAAKHNLASLLRTVGQWGESEALALEVLASRRRVLGNAHPATLASVNNLGDLRLSQGKPDEAEALLREAYEGFLANLGADDPSTQTVKAQWERSLQAIARKGGGAGK